MKNVNLTSWEERKPLLDSWNEEECSTLKRYIVNLYLFHEKDGVISIGSGDDVFGQYDSIGEAEDAVKSIVSSQHGLFRISVEEFQGISGYLPNYVEIDDFTNFTYEEIEMLDSMASLFFR